MSTGVSNDGTELVTISGLHFKPYQMQCMELLAWLGLMDITM
jgi:hypothetical protein